MTYLCVKCGKPLVQVSFETNEDGGERYVCLTREPDGSLCRGIILKNQAIMEQREIDLMEKSK